MAHKNTITLVIVLILVFITYSLLIHKPTRHTLVGIGKREVFPTSLCQPIHHLYSPVENLSGDAVVPTLT